MHTVVIVIVKQVFHRPLTTASVIQHSVSIFFPELASLIIKEGVSGYQIFHRFGQFNILGQAIGECFT